MGSAVLLWTLEPLVLRAVLNLQVFYQSLLPEELAVTLAALFLLVEYNVCVWMPPHQMLQYNLMSIMTSSKTSKIMFIVMPTQTTKLQQWIKLIYFGNVKLTFSIPEVLPLPQVMSVLHRLHTETSLDQVYSLSMAFGSPYLSPSFGVK